MGATTPFYYRTDRCITEKDHVCEDDDHPT
jgi:hypothetical protein